MKQKKHLPIFGVGPLYGGLVIGFTVLCTAGIAKGKLACLDLQGIGCFLSVCTGIFLIVTGAAVWAFAALGKGCIDQYILRNELCTEGVYRFVRNPCYSGILLVCTGVLALFHNLIAVVVFLCGWAVMSVLMKYTEEKWLERQYGQAYLDYCQHVNRVIPWYRKK